MLIRTVVLIQNNGIASNSDGDYVLWSRKGKLLKSKYLCQTNIILSIEQK